MEWVVERCHRREMNSTAEKRSYLYSRSIVYHHLKISCLSDTFSLAYHLLTLTHVICTWWNLFVLSIISCTDWWACQVLSIDRWRMLLFNFHFPISFPRYGRSFTFDPWWFFFFQSNRSGKQSFTHWNVSFFYLWFLSLASFRKKQAKKKRRKPTNWLIHLISQVRDHRHAEK